MSYLRTFLLLFVFSFFLAACGEDTEKEEDTNNDTDIEEQVDDVEVSNEEAPVICLWSAISLKKTPEPKGKWVTTINLGEKATYLGEVVTDTTNAKKPKEFLKIQLADGTTGWVEGRFMAVDVEAYALKEASKLYKRPDILTASKNSFEKLQYVVVLDEQEEWVKVKGIEKSIGWYREGWVKKDHLTNDDIDVTVAVLVYRANLKKDGDKKVEALNEILENTDLSSSQFFSDVRAMVDEIEMPDEEVESEYNEEYEGD